MNLASVAAKLQQLRNVHNGRPKKVVVDREAQGD